MKYDPKIHFKLICLLLIFSIGGCFYPRTVQEVRDNTVKSHTFYMDKNYQQVYREVLDATRKHVGELQVDGDLYTDIKQGVIAVSEHNFVVGNAGIWFIIDVNKITENKTEIVAYTSSWIGKRWVNRIEKWVEKDNKLRENKEGDRER